jgi:hypothetical protein
MGMVKKWQQWWQQRQQNKLTWYWVRFSDSEKATHYFKLLSQPEACGSLLIIFLKDASLSRLYLGLSIETKILAERVAKDFGVVLAPVAVPDLASLQRWEKPGSHHWGNHFFVQLVEGSAVVASGEKKDWKMPAFPPSGVTTHPDWEAYPPPKEVSRMVDTSYPPWLLGLDRGHGNPVQVNGQVTLFGHLEATCHWLIQHCLQALQTNPQGLVILDGKGDLVPQLKRHPAVTSRLGADLTYLDLSQTVTNHGINLLAPVPDETEAETLKRWQTWFLGMGVSSLALPLLVAAQEAGVADMPALQAWLKQEKRRERNIHLLQLEQILNQLLQHEQWGEWLTWGTNVWAAMPAHSLLVNCPEQSWQGQQVLAGLLGATLKMPATRFILYGFPWEETLWTTVQQHPHWLIADPPEPKAATVVLVKSAGKKQEKLADYFLARDEQLRENFMLLRHREGVVVQSDTVYGVTW